jgi:hypothetical protein
MMFETPLLTSIEIHRNINLIWYIAAVFVTIMSLLIAKKRGHFKIAMYVMLGAVILNFVWEILLYGFNMRADSTGMFENMGPVPEILFHGFFETGGTLVLGIEAIDHFKIIDLKTITTETNPKMEDNHGN